MVYWRELGLNYLRFSQIAARELRLAIKPEAAAKYPGQGDATINRHAAYGSKKAGSSDVSAGSGKK